MCFDIFFEVNNPFLGFDPERINVLDPVVGFLDPIVDDTNMVRDSCHLLSEGILVDDIGLKSRKVFPLFDRRMAELADNALNAPKS